MINQCYYVFKSVKKSLRNYILMVIYCPNIKILFESQLKALSFLYYKSEPLLIN